MSTPTLHTQDLTGGGTTLVIDFGADENTTDLAWVATMNDLLDQAATVDGPKILITTGSGKHYSNGLDVAWMAGKESQDIIDYVNSVELVLGRLLTFPAPTIAAINGHAFGAGAFSLIAHDYAVMREDRGYVCWPEVHLGMGFSPGLLAMVKNLLPPRVGREAIVAGPRYSAADAIERGFVDQATSLDTLLDAAVALGAPHAPTATGSVAQIKKQFHQPVMAALGTG